MRIFAFGCSLTQYFYPTWADILIHQYRNKGWHGSNWAKSGAGNMYINMRLWEANSIHKFTKDDIILLQWSSMFREDRYHMGHGWWTPGNFHQSAMEDEAFQLNNYQYTSKWQWADMVHCTMRDCSLISSTHKALDSIGCRVITTNFRDPLEGWEEQALTFNKQNPKLELEDVRAILEVYKKDIETSVPPILNALEFGVTEEFFDTRPKSVPSRRSEHQHMLNPEVHPLTHEAAGFIETYIEDLDSETKDFVETWKNKLIDNDPIYLEDLQWFNSDKVGWSDDRWRP